MEKFRLANSEKEFDLFNKIKLDLKEIKSKIGEPSKLKSPSKVSARGLLDHIYSLHENLLATKIKNSSHLLG